MCLNIILGVPKTGKSREIYENIQQDIQAGKNVVLFVPSQLRAQTEKNYMEYLGLNGIIGVNITTIDKYINDLIEDNNWDIEKEFVSTLDKKILLTQVINDSPELFKVFSSVKGKQGFLDLLYIYMDILRKENIQIDKARKISLDSDLTKLKFDEILSVYEKFNSKLQEQYVDNIDEINMYIKKADTLDYSNTKIYFDSYNNFSESEFIFIGKLLSKVEEVAISLTTDITDKNDIYLNKSNDIFEISNSTYLRLLALANKQGVSVNTKYKYIKHLEVPEDINNLASNLFNPQVLSKKESENIHINLVNNRYDEIEKVASIINEKIRQGYRYSDFIIYTTNIDVYKNIVNKIFNQYSIPIYVDSESIVKNMLLTEYILNLINIGINGLNKDTIFDILKLGLSNIEAEEIFELENYMIEFNVGKYEITHEFKINNSKSSYELDRLNATREKILDMFADIKSIKGKKVSPKEIISIIYNHLLTKDVFNKYEEKLELLKEDITEFDTSRYNEQIQTWDKLSQIFNSICKVYNDTSISLEEFKNIFMLCIKDVKIKSTLPTLDNVQLVDINLAKMNVSKFAFFIGVNENEFPKAVDQDSIFSDIELEKINSSIGKIKETSINKQNMGMYNIYQVLNNITQELYILIPTSDLSGKALRVSNLINQIKKVVNVSILGNIAIKENIDISNIYSKNLAFEYMLELIKNVDLEASDYEEKNRQILTLFKYFSNDERYMKILSYEKNDENLNDDTIERLYSEKLNTSISRLELFKKCPFSYFMKYCLSIEPRQEFEITNLDIGSFMHEVLESFSKYLMDNNIPWQQLLIKEDETIQEKLYNIIDEKLEKVLGKQKSNIKYGILKQKLINTMKKVVMVIAKSFNQSSFEPYGYEIEFKNNGMFAPIEIKLDDDKYLRLIGKIDRIDTLTLEDKMYVRVVDYKSSEKALSLDDIKEGISLQLITYITAFIDNIKNKTDKEIIPAAMLYFNLSDKLVTLKDYTRDEEKLKKETIKALRMKGIFLKDVKVLEFMDNKLASDDRLIDISKLTLTKNSGKAIEKQEYMELFEEAKNILKSIGKEVYSGVVKIRPNKKTNHCKYCNYSNICRKNICV